MLAMLMATTVSAQLAPLTDAPLTAHMAEVNAQWPHMLPDPPDGDRTVRFRDEADRIATHLHRVRTELLARTPLDLPPAQARRRIDLLQRLGTYADARTFPQNHVLPHRNPIFIDPYGTACAVGWLMIESGHGDLAQRIDAVMETGYLAEILADARLGEEVFAWAVSHGFTADELAWIQPAYAPATPVSPLGGGTNGPVRVLLPLNNGHLLVAGTFTQAGTTAAQNVAVWDGSTYHALGAGIGGTVACAVEHDGHLYLGGRELDGEADLARWDGNTWSFIQVFAGTPHAVHALHVHDGTLYAAGEGTGFASTEHTVKQLDDGEWSSVGEPFNDAVLTLASFNGELVAGGAFTTHTGPTEPLILRVAHLTGTVWTQLGEGLDATVRTLLPVGDMLYAGGDRHVDGAYTFGMARIGTDGGWEPLLDGQAVFPVANDHAWISTLVDLGGVIGFGGHFTVESFMLHGTHLGGLVLSNALLVPVIVLHDDVHALALHGGKLVFGGAFTTSSASDLHHVARVDIILGVDAPVAASPTAMAWPNPTTDRVHLAPLPPGARTVHAVDAQGREIPLGSTPAGEGIEVHTEALAPGAYTVRVQTSAATHRVRIIKQ